MFRHRDVACPLFGLHALIYTGFAMSSRAHFYAYILSPDRCYTSAHYHTSSLHQRQAAELLGTVTGHVCPVEWLVVYPDLHKLDHYHHLYFRELIWSPLQLPARLHSWLGL